MSPLISDALLRAQSDDRLATLAGQGHERAFGVLVERYRPSLVRAATRIVGPDRAEDVSQQALLGAWRALQSGARVRHVRGWLFQALRHTIYTEHARTRQHAELADDLADPRPTSVLAEQNIELAATLAALASLPDHQRVAIAQTELAGRSRRDIARDLGLSEGAVRQLVHRARVTLRQAVTALTPLQLAELAARTRGGSRLSEHVAQLTAAGSAGAGGVAAAGAGSGAALVGAGTMIKGAAALLAVVGAVGGALAIRSHPRPTHPGAVEVRAPSTQADGSVAQASDAGAAAKGPAGPDRGASLRSHTRRASHHATHSVTPAPGVEPAQPAPASSVAPARHSHDAGGRSADSAHEGDRSSPTRDHPRAGGEEPSGSADSTQTSTVSTSADQGTAESSAGAPSATETTVTTTTDG
ncbi:MAG: sigma-70 family RNA polymerase sigma factor [Acidobacteriota bacterium]|nr:sigma-70 family RNA polymerase sigma factor [Acidobacteriota bacterium]